MSTATIVIFVIAIAIVFAIAASIAVRSSRSRRQALAERFGPEYERTVGAADGGRDRRRAEHDLAERADRRDDLDIHPLPVEAREKYSEQWQQAQQHFVDEPQTAIGEAEQLLDAVMRERGYPVDGFEDQAALVSVDHADVVENYRGEVSRMIASTVERWDAESTSRRLELQVGRDLQFIRINGTIVGGLAGLAIHVITRVL